MPYAGFTAHARTGKGRRVRNVGSTAYLEAMVLSATCHTVRAGYVL